MDFLKNLSARDDRQDTVAKPTGGVQGAETHAGGAPSGGGWMGKLNEAIGGGQAHNEQKPVPVQSGGGGLMGMLNEAMGGGAKSEKNEDYLDKGVDWVQEHVLGAGQQTNESALEQAKDEQISDAIRRAYKNTMGHEMPIKDKEH